jgi:periodic tryptophan protein 1
MAVGTFSPAIEIWNLDVLDPLEPTAVLGGIDPKAFVSKKSGKKSKKNKGKQQGDENEGEWLPGSHEDSVMALSWNRTYRQALASGSADMSVKIWDVTTQACSLSFAHHTDKVQAVVWNPAEAWLLASAAFDKTIKIVDCRAPVRTNCL